MLGERELALLGALADHKIASTDQIAVLFYDSVRRAQQILSELRSADLIETFGWRSSARESDRHYLTHTGARVVARSRGCRVAELSTLPASPAHARALMPHRSGVNAFFCTLVAECLKRPGYGLESWRDEHKVTTGYGEVQPDGFGRLLHPGGATEFYFEYDLATEHRQALVGKFTAYLRVASHWNHPDERPFPSALFVVPGQDRELDLLRLLGRAVQHWRAEDATTMRLPFYSSTVTRVRHQTPLGAVWRPMFERGAGRLRLDELPAVSADGYELDECLGRRWRRTGVHG